MAKRLYAGVDNKARNIKKIYAGIAGTARKVKRGYIGIGGKARPFWTGGELAYWGSSQDGAVEGLSRSKEILTAIAHSTHLFFAGGQRPNYQGANASSTVDAYNKQLTRFNPTNIAGSSQPDVAAASLSDYAFFIRDVYGNGAACAFGLNLTRHTLTDVYSNADGLHATAVKDYVIYTQNNLECLYFYNHDLTQSMQYTESRISGNPAVVGQYGLFINPIPAYNTFAFNNELTVQHIPCVPLNSGYNVVCIDGYAICIIIYQNTQVYNTDLTIIQLNKIGEYELYGAATAGLKEYGLIGGGRIGASSYGTADVKVYNSNLTVSQAPPLCQGRYGFAGGAIGDKAIFAGGATGQKTYSYTNTVDVYTT